MRRIVGALAATLLAWGPSHAGVETGSTISSTNCAEVADLLPPPVFDWVKKGDLTLQISEMQDEVAWEEPFLQASKANADRYGVDAEGGLIERRSGARPPHTYGFPFPHIDPEDPNAGVEVMWNATVTTYKFGRVRGRFALHWIGRSGFERLVDGRGMALAFDYQPVPVPNPDRTEVRDIFQALGPASVDGLASLTWRYMDNRPDAVWGYLPAMRRVRQLTAANRSDPLYGSDFVQDDALLWAGKNQSFRWKLVRAQDVLVSTIATSYVQLVPGKSWKGGREYHTPPSYPGARFGWESAEWQGAPWMVTNAVWVQRPVWVVEGEPKDPYYSYGRQVFYIDRSTFKTYYKVVYTPAGEYWKTLISDLGIGVSEDGVRQIVFAAIIAIDDRTDHASYTRGNAPDFITEYNSAFNEPEVFTVNGLLRLGK
jgi:hypothetical protein